MPTSTEAATRRLIEFYEQLSAQRLEQLPLCYAPQARFCDPFNDVQGLAAIAQIFAHMFANLERPRFIITSQLVQGERAFLTWEFHFRLRRWRRQHPLVIAGGSLLRFDSQGLVLEHRDYWDPAQQLYEQLPLLGPLMRWLRRAGSAGAG